MIKNKLIFVLLMSFSGLCLADAMCGPGGEFNPGDNQCYPVQDRRTSSPPAPRRVDLWGAIAVDTNGTTSHASNNYRNAQAAQKAALAGCGLTSCKVAITYKNGCGAVATNKDLAASGDWGTTSAQAEKAAIQRCQNDFGKDCVTWVSASCSKM